MYEPLYLAGMSYFAGGPVLFLCGASTAGFPILQATIDIIDGETDLPDAEGRFIPIYVEITFALLLLGVLNNIEWLHCLFDDELADCQVSRARRAIRDDLR